MQDWWAMAGLILAGSITPGPNNALALRAGLAGDRKDALAVMVGVQLGGLVILVLCWAGATALLTAHPLFAPALTIAGASYLAWLGVALMRTGASGPLAAGRRLGMLPVAALQFVNPKAWILLATIAAAAADRAESLATVAALLVIISAASLLVWTSAGRQMSRLLSSPEQRRWFDRALGLLLIVSALALIFSQSHGSIPNGA